MAENKPTPVQWIAGIMALIEVTAKWIGSVEWKGRFRTATKKGLQAVTEVSEANTEAIKILTEKVAQLESEIKSLKGE